MLDIGFDKLVVLAVVAMVVLGPDKLPGLARDAARMLKTLRELATGARQQLRDELGPEFSDVDFRNLNPRTAITRAVFGDEPPDLQKYNPRNFDLRASARGLFAEEDEPPQTGTVPISMTKPTSPVSMTNDDAPATAPRPRPRPRPVAHYDSDIT